nr:hypothetical protein [Tanacetum cinerariifolium]
MAIVTRAVMRRFTTLLSRDVGSDGVARFCDAITPSNLLRVLHVGYRDAIAIIGDIGAYKESDNRGQQQYKKNEITRRAIDILNLDGNNIEFLMWNEIAFNFNMHLYEALSKPVLTVVSSCRTPVGGHSNNSLLYKPNISSTEDAIVDEPFQQNPHSYLVYKRGNANKHQYKKPWHYMTCSDCIIKVTIDGLVLMCRDHGPHQTPSYRCSELLQQLDDKDPYHFPPLITTLVGKQLSLNSISILPAKWTDDFLVRLFKANNLPQCR